MRVVKCFFLGRATKGACTQKHPKLLPVCWGSDRGQGALSGNQALFDLYHG